MIENKARTEQKIQKIKVTGQLEVKSLKSTIEDLRDELERAELDKSDLEGKISSRFAQEIKSLQSSLVQAREKCERLLLEKEDISQSVTSKFQKEITNLKVNITQTRESLEQAKIEKMMLYNYAFLNLM